MSDEVLVERRGAVQVVTINRPQARNALDAAVARGIAAAVDDPDASPEPRAVALEMLLTGLPVDAERAAAVGLVNRVVEDGAALDVAVELAAVVGANGPLAVAATERIVQEAPSWSPAEAWARQEEIVRPVFASDDAGEGSTAFAERRSPLWRGR